MKQWVSLSAIALVIASAAFGDAPKQKPRIAFFPIGGTVKEELRAKVGFSLRAKLDRTQLYDVISGPEMGDLAEAAEGEINAQTPAAAIRKLAEGSGASVLAWGEMNGTTLRIKLLDLREAEPRVQEISKEILEPTDLRFVSEEILETLPGVARFEHPNEEAVRNDATAEELWRTNPNLVANGDFADNGAWEGLYEAQKYSVKISDQPPARDKVLIWRIPQDAAGGKLNNVLAMNLSRTAAENNGLACLSAPFKIAPDTRYRLSFRYRSDGPKLHVFVKGYTMAENIKGEAAEREVYRRQVPPTGNTQGEWVEIVDELNPQHVAFPVTHLRVDLYAYLHPGQVLFDDVVIKAVGEQTRQAKDAAIKLPLSRPRSATAPSR